VFSVSSVICILLFSLSVFLCVVVFLYCVICVAAFMCEVNCMYFENMPQLAVGVVMQSGAVQLVLQLCIFCRLSTTDHE